VPDGYRSLTPVLTVHDAAGAIEFYKRAFGAREIGRMVAEDGKRVVHAELEIGDSRVMLSDEFPEWGGSRSPKSLGGTTGSLHLYVEDADEAFGRALEAGATAEMPLEDAFWGDRYGVLVDPYGLRWGIATHVEDVSDEELARRAKAQMNSQPV